jgi:hypothetical protein
MGDREHRNGLEYTRVNGDVAVTVYRVNLIGAEKSDNGRDRWGGNIGYRAIGTFRKPIYRAGSRNPVGHTDQEIEVVVNGPGLGKARRKLYNAAEILSQNPFTAVTHNQKRAAAKARKKSRRAAHQQDYSFRPRSWW